MARPVHWRFILGPIDVGPILVLVAVIALVVILSRLSIPIGGPQRVQPEEPVPSGDSVVRVYRGKQQADAVAAFREDAERLALRGYQPTSQSWAPGQWGAGAFLIAVLLMIVLIGFLIFLYLLIVKPEGTLTVTYARATTQAESQVPSGSEPAPEQPIGNAPLAARLAELNAARDAGHLTDEEYAAKRAEIIQRF
jgi:uncharacterized membrane protein